MRVFLEQGLVRCMGWLESYPWLFAMMGFASGLASYLLVERSPEIAQVLALLMLFSWVWLILENVLKRGAWHFFGVNVPRPVFRFVAQMVHQESLFFVIPFFLTTTTWHSSQLLFTSLLIIAAFVSIWDPLYYRWLSSRRWLYFRFHGVTLFALLLTALPLLFQLPTTESYLWALLVAGLVSLPSVAGDLPASWKRQSGALILLVVLAASIGWWARPWVPPATLWLTEVAISDHLDDENRTPVRRMETLSAASLDAGLYAYTAIHAPRGLNERIYHVWYHNGKEVDRISLDISGGREEGYRSWTHKLNFPEKREGKWKIRVLTAANQLIGELHFSVTAATQPMDSQPPAETETTDAASESEKALSSNQEIE